MVTAHRLPLGFADPSGVRRRHNGLPTTIGKRVSEYCAAAMREP